MLVAVADDGDRVEDGVDVVAFDGGDVTDPQAGVIGEQDDRSGAFVHSGVEQAGEVLVCARSGPPFFAFGVVAIKVESSGRRPLMMSHLHQAQIAP